MKLSLISLLAISIVLAIWFFTPDFITDHGGSGGDRNVALNALFAGFAFAVIAVTLIFQQGSLREEQKHRSKPQVVLLQEPIYGYFYEFKKGLMPVIWSRNELSESEAIQTDQDSAAFFRIMNIGNGAAQELNLAWEIKLDTIIKEINEFSTKNKIPVCVEKNQESVGIVLRHNEKIQMNQKADFINHRDYLLPAASEPEGWACRIPFILREITAAMLFIVNWSADQQIEGGEKFYNSPEFQIDLTYKDIGANVYKKKISGKLEFYTMTLGGRPGEKAFQGSWKFMEK